jgi:hypothetical protein
MALALAAQSPSRDSIPSGESVVGYHPGPGDDGHFWRYFFFWKGGIAPEAARADFRECADYARDPVLWARIPDRLPLDGGVRGPNGTEGSFGPSGAVIFALVEGGLVRRIALANMRRCMGFKGYRRYGLSASLWRPLNEGSPEQVIERLAAIAGGPEPRQPAIAP